MDEMDIDQPSSSSKRPATSPLASSSAEKRAKILPQAQLTMINDNMEQASVLGLWQVRIGLAADDRVPWSALFFNVMVHLMVALEATDIKSSVISANRARGVVDSFNNDAFEQW